MDAVARYVARKPMPPAVVAGAGGASGLAAIRMLARAGVPVIAIDHRVSPLGFRSRLALGVHSPDPAGDPERFFAFLVELSEALGRPAPTFPTDDDYLNGVVAAADRLAGRYLVPAPSWDVLQRIQTTRSQLERARELGIPADDPDGGEFYSVGSYVTTDGEALGVFSGRGREPVWVDEIVDRALAFIRGIGFHGIAHTTFSLDPHDGFHKLTGITPRLWRGHDRAALSGVDLPRIAYWALLGARLPPVTSKDAGSRPAAARLPRGAVLEMDDPAPALAQGARFVRGLFR